MFLRYCCANSSHFIGNIVWETLSMTIRTTQNYSFLIRESHKLRLFKNRAATLFRTTENCSTRQRDREGGGEQNLENSFYWFHFNLYIRSVRTNKHKTMFAASILCLVQELGYENEKKMNIQDKIEDHIELITLV